MLARQQRIDVLVNNVGHYLRSQPFAESDPEHWQALHRINLEQVFHVTRAALPALRAQRRGSIVNVASVEGIRGYPPDPVYGAYKAAVVHFTKCLALELAPDVRVNAIAPDLTQSLQVDYERWVPDGRAPQVEPVGAARTARHGRRPGRRGRVPRLRRRALRDRLRDPDRRRLARGRRLVPLGARGPLGRTGRSIRDVMKLGWIGLGVMGASMCAHLRRAGHELTVHTRTPARADECIALGCVWADSPRAVAEASDVVFTMVGFPRDVREVVLGERRRRSRGCARAGSSST